MKWVYAAYIQKTATAPARASDGSVWVREAERKSMLLRFAKPQSGMHPSHKPNRVCRGRPGRDASEVPWAPLVLLVFDADKELSAVDRRDIDGGVWKMGPRRLCEDLCTTSLGSWD
jgi:hypothetical protein